MSENRSQLHKDTKKAHTTKAKRKDSLLSYMTHMPSDMPSVGIQIPEGYHQMPDGTIMADSEHYRGGGIPAFPGGGGVNPYQALNQEDYDLRQAAYTDSLNVHDLDMAFMEANRNRVQQNIKNFTPFSIAGVTDLFGNLYDGTMQTAPIFTDTQIEPADPVSWGAGKDIYYFGDPAFLDYEKGDGSHMNDFYGESIVTQGPKQPILPPKEEMQMKKTVTQKPKGKLSYKEAYKTVDKNIYPTYESFVEAAEAYKNKDKQKPADNVSEKPAKKPVYAKAVMSTEEKPVSTKQYPIQYYDAADSLRKQGKPTGRQYLGPNQGYKDIYKQDGGQVMELDDAAIEHYRSMGYVVEEVDTYPDGGQVISEYGWDYSMDPQGNYITRKNKDGVVGDWITPAADSDAGQAIANRYGSRLNAQPSAPVDVSPQADLQPTTNKPIADNKPFIRDFEISNADLDMLNNQRVYKTFDSHDEAVAWNKDKKYKGKQINRNRDGKYDASYKEFCPSGQCLEQAFNAYDKVIGQNFPSTLFPSEAKYKEGLNMQSASFNDERGNYDEDIYKAASDRVHNWVDNNKYMDSEQGDFTVDSWDIHGQIQEEGGVNLYTQRLDRSDGASAKWADSGIGKMTPEEQKELYAKIPVGAIIGFGDAKSKDYGLNNQKGLAASHHSAMVVGYNKEGVPIVYDYGKYTTLDKNKFDLAVTNISYPKELEGRTQSGLAALNKKATPTQMDFDYSPLIAQGADKEEMDKFYGTLQKNKKSLMNDLNIPNAEYDDMSKVLMAISMQESEGGNSVEDNIMPHWTSTMLGDTQGLTQLNVDNILKDEKLAPIARKYGITTESDLHDPDKAAIASMIYATRNKSTAEKNFKTGAQGGERIYRAPDRFSGKAIQNMLMNSNTTYDGETFRTEEGATVEVREWGMDRDIADINADLNNIAPGRYRAYLEKGDVVIAKKTAGNAEELTPQEKFIYNWQSPYALATGDAQGGSVYSKQIMANYKAINSSTEQLAQRTEGSSPMPLAQAEDAPTGPLRNDQPRTGILGSIMTVYEKGGEVKAEDYFVNYLMNYEGR